MIEAEFAVRMNLTLLNALLAARPPIGVESCRAGPSAGHAARPPRARARARADPPAHCLRVACFRIVCVWRVLFPCACFGQTRYATWAVALCIPALSGRSIPSFRLFFTLNFSGDALSAIRLSRRKQFRRHKTRSDGKVSSRVLTSEGFTVSQ